MKKWKQTFTLVDDATGQSIKALVVARGGKGGRFMKLWQGTGWEEKLWKLQGNSLKVLYYLLGVATWENVVPGPSEVAVKVGKKQPHISLAYKELMTAGFLHKEAGDGGEQRRTIYRLDPYFCWKGTDAQREQVCQMALDAVQKRLNEGVHGCGGRSGDRG